jgi:hypothetical protein
MKKEENLNKKNLEKPKKSDINKDEVNNNKLSDERLNKKLDLDSIKDSKMDPKKHKKKYTNKKRKSIEMYFVFFIFFAVSTLCTIIHNFALNTQIDEILEKNKKLSLAAFIILLIGAFIFSIIISCCECLIKTHFLGIIFYIVLNLAIDYCVVYISYLSFFEEAFCFLIVIVSGSFGCLIITLLVKDDISSIYILLLINLLFCLICGLIVFFIYKKLWARLFAVFGLIISEFNVYSSQYKLCSKDKKLPITYSQPFELIISFFKMLFFLFNIIVKLVKFFARICKCKEKEDKDEAGKDNENVPTEDIEAGVDNNEQNIDNNVEIGNNKNMKKK